MDEFREYLQAEIDHLNLMIRASPNYVDTWHQKRVILQNVLAIYVSMKENNG